MKSIPKDLKNIFHIILFTLVYSYMFDANFSLQNAMSALLIFNCAVYISGTLISYKFNLEYIDRFEKGLVLAFLGIGIVTFACVYIIIVGTGTANYMGKVTRINALYSLYEGICLVLAVKLYRINISYRTAILIVGFTSLFVSYICIKSNNPLFLDLEQYKSINNIIFKIISIAVKIYLIKLLYNIKSDIVLNTFYYLNIFIIARIVVEILLFMQEMYKEAFAILFLFIIEYIANYCILKIMIVDIIRAPYLNIYNNLIKKSESLKDTSRKLSKVWEEKEALNINYEKIRRDDEIKNELLTNISHEFKTPVNVIYSAVQTQDILKSNGNIQDILKYNSIIKKNCNRLIRLTNNFIDITRLKDENITINFKYFNLINLIEKVIMPVIPFAESKNLNIIFDTNDEELYVKVDEQLFDRLILNLLSNAIKYSKETGEIHVKLSNDDNNVEITVEDQGIGISKENFKIIFDKFERIDQSFSRNTEGSGLGLNIVKEIVNIFNGSIKFESELGFGTSVKVKLPLACDIDESDRENLHKDIYSDVSHEREAEIELSDIYL